MQEKDAFGLSPWAGMSIYFCSRFEYGGAMENSSLGSEWKEVPCQARQVGKEKHKILAVGYRK